MHVPDGFIDVPTSAAAAIGAGAVVAYAVRRCRDELDERMIPLAGVTSAFIFAAQMLNFPIGGGTSGHIMGAALAAVLLGPHLATLSVTVVVCVQALLFADGGLSALGLNVLNMAIVGAYGGWFVFLALRRILGSRPRSVVVASGLAATFSVTAAASVFVLEYSAGGAAEIPFRTLFGAMFGVHLLIGLGEGLITAQIVSVVAASRPDLVAGMRPKRHGAAPTAIEVTA